MTNINNNDQDFQINVQKPKKTSSLPKINGQSTTSASTLHTAENDYEEGYFRKYRAKTVSGAMNNIVRKIKSKDKRLSTTASLDSNEDMMKVTDSLTNVDTKKSKTVDSKYTWVHSENWTNKLPIINNKCISLSGSWSRAHFDLAQYKQTLEN